MQINGLYWGADNWAQKATLACSSTLYPILPKSGDTGGQLVIKVDAAGKVYLRSYDGTYIEETIYMLMDWPKG